MNHLLYYIPSPSDWSTAQVANVIALSSVLVALITLWHTYRRNKKQDGKINDLENIVSNLAAANELQEEHIRLRKLEMNKNVKPNLYIEITSHALLKNEFDLIIKNKAAIAYFDFGTVDGVFIDWPSPTKIEIDKPLKLKVKTLEGTYKWDCKYTIFIHFKDAYENKYVSIGRGDGTTPPELHCYPNADFENQP